MTPAANPSLGCVVIGRNEGARLHRCLDSVLRQCQQTVYVDSASLDGSAGWARSRSVEVHEVDPARPLSAARARNEGLEVLKSRFGGVEFVQFVDGDCELADGWLAAAMERLRARGDLAVVIGRARELDAGSSVYNRLADIEWGATPGEIDACGGVAMMRLAALDQVGPYDTGLIAGEEPELCLRLRRAGWRLECLAADMMVHDLAMTRFSQWWKRMKRAGFAYANGAFLHGSGPERYCVRQVQRIAAWGGVVPAIALAAAAFTQGLGLVALLGYAWPFRGAYRFARSRGRTAAEARLYAFWCTLGKLPEFHGVLAFRWNRWFGRRAVLIEHK